MSSMNNFMEAYRAVHNPEAKEEFYAKRDSITEMNLTSLFHSDLVDITEQVVAKLFETLTVNQTKELVVETFCEVPAVQEAKVDRILEAFKTVFQKVDEVAATVAREQFSQYLNHKRLDRQKAVMNSIEESQQRFHRHAVAGDVENVKNLLLTMLEKKLDAVGKEDADIDNDGDVDSSDKYLHKRRKAIGKAMGKKDKKDDDEKGEEVSEGHGMHRDAKTGKVVDKAEVGKTYYPNQPKKKTSVTKKPDAFGGRFNKEEFQQLDELSTDTLNSYVGKAQSEYRRRWEKADKLDDVARKAEKKGDTKRAKRLDKRADRNVEKAQSREDGAHQAVSKIQKAHGINSRLNKEYPPKRGANVPAQKSTMLSRAKAKVKKKVNKMFSKEELDRINAIVESWDD